MKILIAGGGIGGLSVAIALQQKGFDWALYEAAPELKPVGAGIWMAPNALQIFQRLGVADAVKSAGNLLERADVLDHRGLILTDIDNRRSLEKFGQPLCAIHRGRLQQALAAQLDPAHIHLGKRVRTTTQDANGVRLEFEDGTAASGDLLVGADGIHSAVRRSIFGDIPLRYSGQTCWRGIAQYELPGQTARQGFEYWGVRSGLRIGFSQVHAGEVYWYLTLAAPPADARLSNALSDLAALAGHFPAPSRALVENTPEASIIRSDLFDFKPIGRWHSGRVVLLGDAGHATTPNLGQGGCQAVEDAWVLADLLAEHRDHVPAFVEFERLRMPKVRNVVNSSFMMARLTNWGGAWGAALRNALVRSIPTAMTQRQTDAIFRLDY